MLIQHQQNDHRGSFFVGEDNNRLAEMTYKISADNKMIMEHTEVSDELRGQNAGYQLVHTAVEYARTHAMKIVPLCPFAASVFKKKPEYADVLAA